MRAWFNRLNQVRPVELTSVSVLVQEVSSWSGQSILSSFRNFRNELAHRPRAAGTTSTLSAHQLIWADLPRVRRHRSRNAPWSKPGTNKRARVAAPQ
jgi:hypothetical protein